MPPNAQTDSPQPIFTDSPAAPPNLQAVREAADAAEAQQRQSTEAATAAADAARDAVLGAGVNAVRAMARYSRGDGGAASQRDVVAAAENLGRQFGEYNGIDGGVTTRVDFDRNGDFHVRMFRASDGFPIKFDLAAMEGYNKKAEKWGYEVLIFHSFTHTIEGRFRPKTDAEDSKAGFMAEMKEAYKNGDLGEEWKKILKLCDRMDLWE